MRVMAVLLLAGLSSCIDCGAWLIRGMFQRELVETWDLSDGRELSRVNWGAKGWSQAEHGSGLGAQFAGPVRLTLLLSEERRIEGYFTLVRVTSYRDEVSMISADGNRSSRREAYEEGRGFLESLRADEETVTRLDAWYEAGGDERGPLLYLRNYPGPPSLSVEVIKTFSFKDDHGWRVLFTWSWGFDFEEP